MNELFQKLETLWPHDLPECPISELRTIVDESKILFRTLPGNTDYAAISQQQVCLSESHCVAFLNSIALNWKSILRTCWRKASSRSAAVHGWHQLCMLEKV